MVREWLPEGAEFFALAAAALLGMAAEAWHQRRVRRVALLAFGPEGKPSAWARGAPFLRVLALAALAYGLVTLLSLPPESTRARNQSERRKQKPDHIVLVLDVSPSMRLSDAGPDFKLTRMARAREVMESFFKRVPMDEFLVSVIAVYNGAKPVVIDTRDLEVVRNILGALPMHYAFEAGKTRIFDGLVEAARIAKPWNPKSTTVILVSDGDTVPATGMPTMPDSVRSVLIVGVGDPRTGKFIDGKNSRQDVSTLRQIALRLGGSFHDGNQFHLPTDLINDATRPGDQALLERLGRREYALLAAGFGALTLTALPLLLGLFGTNFRPGTRKRAEFSRKSPPPADATRSQDSRLPI